MWKHVSCIPGAVLCIIVLVPSGARASSIYLNIAAIPGESSIPGDPNAIAVQTLTLGNHGFSISKEVDKASPTLAKDVVTGKLLGTATLDIYNSTPTTSPDALLSFSQVLATSYQVNGGAAGPPVEEVGFSSTTNPTYYLDVPGIKGEVSLPGFANVLPVQSFSLSGDAFSVIRSPDAASVQLALAAAKGASFANARLLIYDSTPTGTPDATLLFQDVFVSSFQLLGITTIQEEDGFHFGNILPSSPATTPEPSSLVLLSIGAVGLAAAGCRCRPGRAE